MEKTAAGPAIAWERYRDEFPIFAHTTYFNTCSLGALSVRVESAMRTFAEHWHRAGAAAWYQHWLGETERLRSAFAALIGADPDEVALFPSITAALGAVAGSFDHRARPKVVISELEFPTTVYQWLVSDGVGMQVGFLVDELTALMMVVVTFVSLCVHVYTIGYMAEDPGYQRFFSYISLFTFSMLMLVMANNFLQLFFGWEAVGLVSEALETVERARGALYDFHQLTGGADLKLGEAVEKLREAGHDRIADEVEREIIGRNVLDGRWTFQIVEEYDDGYYATFKRLEKEARDTLVEGKRHLYESEMKEARRTQGRHGHESRPEPGA